eukprot:scaffold517_cov140-Skeletonema_marinoi.AAC.10
MSKWNHDGWHQDGWQDDGWNDDGHNQMGWKGDDDRARLRKCAYSDCCEADRRGRDFSLYDRFLRTQNGNGECRLRDENGRTGFKERCNKRDIYKSILAADVVNGSRDFCVTIHIHKIRRPDKILTGSWLAKPGCLWCSYED